ncbi:hypothetical protein [Sphingomonas sp. IC081]|uniref:hypothetical protein n=1 Tax=Sphingomonas sp. IC081 TaxID=304378 RepID=UPI0011577F70|nr:hypothetical protein [Sphingomonas sp. IC081]
MKRKVAKLLSFFATFLFVYFAVVWPLKSLFPDFMSEWSAAICGALASLTVTAGNSIFDRRWPKPKAGWSE